MIIIYLDTLFSWSFYVFDELFYYYFDWEEYRKNGYDSKCENLVLPEKRNFYEIRGL